MSDKKLNWGLLSTARINEAVIGPIRSSNRNHLLAVGSRNEAKARDYAHKWDIPRHHGTYEALLADPEIDIIYNSLPNSLHHPWTLAAARTGKHVLCEKPLALTGNDVEEMAAAAKENHLIIAEAFMYRHHPQTIRVVEMVSEGKIGQLRLVRGSFSFRLENLRDVRLNPTLGGGSIWDIGCYPISYIRTIFGEEPVEVFGAMDPSDSGVDLSFVGQMEFPGNRFGQFECSFAGPFRWEIEVVGTQGSLWIPNPYKPGYGDTIELRTDSGAETVAMPERDLYSGEVEDMADAVLLGQTPRISLEDSRNNVAVINALLRSTQVNQPIKLNST